MSAHYWYLFWTANLVIAGSAFFIITVVVMIRGIGDLKGMFARLRVSGTHRDFLRKERQNPHS
jgi:hypothetical protein